MNRTLTIATVVGLVAGIATGAAIVVSKLRKEEPKKTSQILQPNQPSMVEAANDTHETDYQSDYFWNEVLLQHLEQEVGHLVDLAA